LITSRIEMAVLRHAWNKRNWSKDFKGVLRNEYANMG